MYRDLPPLTALRAFEAVGRHGSVTRAGQELNVSYAAVSQQVKVLEAWLGGVRLTRRAGRSIALSEAGERYYRRLGSAFREMEEATAELRQNEAGRPLEVATTPSFLARWLMPRLARFQARHPDVRLRLNPGRDLVDFDREPVDLAIRYGLGDWPGLLIEPLIGGRMMPICAPSIISATRPLKVPQDLAHHVLLHDTDTSEWAMWLERAGLAEVDLGRGPIHAGSAYVLEAAIQGLGVALGAVDMLKDDIAAGRLIVPFDTALNPDCAYYLVRPEGRPERPAAKAFRQWLREEARLAVDEGLFYSPTLPISSP